MEIIKQVLFLIIPAGLVLLTAFYILKKFFENEDKKRSLELRKDSNSVILPIRLQAYERVILFLERISPESLIMRVHKKNMNARTFQTELLQTIRTEFEHNIAQQIYISNSSWELVKRSKEEMIKIVNIASSKVTDSATGLDLSRAIFTISSELDKLPTHIAIDYLKKEIRQSF